MCWCKSGVVVSCRPTWHPSASPIHLQAFLGGCLCVECSTPWSLGPNGVWERGLGFFSLCSAVQTRCCHTATPSFPRSTFTPVFMSVPFTICHMTDIFTFFPLFLLCPVLLFYYYFCLYFKQISEQKSKKYCSLLLVLLRKTFSGFMFFILIP